MVDKLSLKFTIKDDSENIVVLSHIQSIFPQIVDQKKKWCLIVVVGNPVLQLHHSA